VARKRRTFSSEFKVDAVMDLLTGARAAAEICRERDITDKLLYRWKNEMLERLPGVFERGQAESNEAEQRIAELERMVGRLALENEILKNAASWREAHRQRNDK
jgi:transposase